MSWGDAQYEPSLREGLAASLRSVLSPTSIVNTWIMVYVGALVPVISFAMTWDSPPQMPEWQSGHLHAYLSFFLSGRVGYVFYPLMLYAMVCFLMVLFREEQCSEYFIVRLGVYSGVAMGIHYSVLLSISLFEAADWLQAIAAFPFIAMGAAIIGVSGIAIAQALVLVVYWLYQWLGWQGLVSGVLALLFAAAAFAVMYYEEGGATIFLVPFFMLFILSVIFGPFWMTAAYARLALKLLHKHWEGGQFRIGQMLVIFTWLGGYLAACRQAMALAVVEYQKLPTEPPQDCYIATAAARGHHRLVGSRLVALQNGTTMRVNHQLQVFKCGEILIRSLSPRSHRVMRRIYDRLGPALAKRVHHPLLADAVYLSLKPLEWVASVMLRLLLRNSHLRIEGMYSREHTPANHAD